MKLMTGIETFAILNPTTFSQVNNFNQNVSIIINNEKLFFLQNHNRLQQRVFCTHTVQIFPKQELRKVPGFAFAKAILQNLCFSSNVVGKCC